MNKTKKNSNRSAAISIARIAGSAIFGLIGVLICGFIVYICANFHSEKPILTFSPVGPRERVIGFMDHFCQGEYNEAEKYLLGHPDIGADLPPEDRSAKLIWDAYTQSTSFELVGDCYTTNDGLVQKIRFTYLDISSVTKNLNERSKELLKDRVNSASSVSEIYDANNEYRSDVVNDVLYQAVTEAINEDSVYVTAEVDIYLCYRDNTWWIDSNQTLIDVLFGDLLFYST